MLADRAGRGDGEPACKAGFCHRPVYRGPDGMAIIYAVYPGKIGRAAPLLFDLARVGLPRAARITPGAGCALAAPFPLTCDAVRRSGGGPSRSVFLWHFPEVTRLAVSQPLPCGVPTFLGRVAAEGGGLVAAIQPAHRSTIVAPIHEPS